MGLAVPVSLLVALKMGVHWLAKRLDDRPQLQLQCNCRGMGRLIDSAVDNLGRIITDLRPSILDHQGLWAALEWQAQAFFAHGAERLADGHGDLQPDLPITSAAGVPSPESGQAIAILVNDDRQHRPRPHPGANRRAQRCGAGAGAVRGAGGVVRGVAVG